jgi:hypothetical protein
MSIFQVSDESVGNIASVLSNKGLKVSQAYSYVFLASGAATGNIAPSPGILHAVIFQDSATATTYLGLYDMSDTASAQVLGNSASAIAVFGTITKNTFPMNVIFNKLNYRVSGSAIGPTTIVYSLAS